MPILDQSLLGVLVEAEKIVAVLVAAESGDCREDDAAAFVVEQRHPGVGAQAHAVHESFGPVGGEDAAVFGLQEDRIEGRGARSSWPRIWL